MIPQRTCVGCRSRFDQPALNRFVRSGGSWIADGHRRSDGRGAYVCGLACARRVIKNKRYPGLGLAAVAQYELQDATMHK